MAERVIPLADQRYASARPRVPLEPHAPSGNLLDALGRPLRDLRISVTDRCNFRCSYCMPKEVFDKNYAFLPHASLLTFEEITRVARLFAAHGMRKVRLTGGEPLLRKNLEILVGMLRELRSVDGRPLDLTLTTNGSLLGRKAQALKDAGLDRVTVSLDALDDAHLPAHERRRLPGRRRCSTASPRRARPASARSRSTWSSSAAPTTTRSCRWRATSRAAAAILRFIEYMDVGATNGWRMDEVLPSAEVVRRIAAHHPVEPIAAGAEGETAQRWRYLDGSGEIGVISSVTQAFCQRLQPRPPVDRRQAVPLPVRQPRARPARAAARRLQRRADRGGDRADLERARRPLFRAARARRRRRRPRPNSLASRCTTSAADPMIARDEITGLILAGGRGSRMGGVDKGLQNHLGIAARAACAAAARPAGRPDA